MNLGKNKKHLNLYNIQKNTHNFPAWKILHRLPKGDELIKPQPAREKEMLPKCWSLMQRLLKHFKTR